MSRIEVDLPPRWAQAVAVVLLALITWIDSVSGYELGLFIFYFVPVSLAAWYAGRRSGLVLAVASAICWFASDLLAGHPYSRAYLIYWETFMRLVSFVTTALTLNAIREGMRQREDLLNVVSHDLRLPLTALAGQAQLLRKHGGDASFAAARAEAILRSARNMERMIDDLLDGARWKAGKLHLELEPVDLVAWVPQVLERLGDALEIERVDLALASRPAVVRADPRRLERVVLNLLSNALKYSPPEGRVRLGVAITEAGGATLTVSDQGQGIAAVDRAHLFERFHRGRGAAERDGVGLGLYSARLLVDAHGGAIRVESEPGEGASFTVEFPPAGGW